MRTRFYYLLALTPLWLVLSSLANAQDTASAPPGDHLELDNVPGGLYLWQIPNGASGVKYDGKPVLKVNNTAIIGIHINTKPGQGSIEYVVDQTPRQHHFDIVAKQYTEQHITIQNQNMVDPPEDTLKRIRAESARQGRLYRAHAEQQQVGSGFIQPLQGIVTSLFGHRRFFNGKPRSPHSGLDIAADAGTPILAAGDAIVTLADDLYFNGNTLFLDHGQGLITMYCHMSKHLVAEGDKVTKGQEIGLVGATGRATGPHLHWSVSLNGTRVDPQKFMAALNEVTAR